MKSIKRILATTLMLVMVFTTVMGTFSVSAAAAVTCTNSLVVVDDDFSYAKNGSTVSATVAGTTYTGKLGTTAFATIAEALEAVASQGSIYVAAGVYSDPIVLNKGVSIYGNMMDVNPNDLSDISKPAANRAVTGANESILQDTQIYYAPIAANEVLFSNYNLVLNGFAISGDSCINLQGNRYSNAYITISNNVFDLVNENAYSNMGISANSFNAIQFGSQKNNANIANAATVENNRFERIGYAGKGLSTINAIDTSWILDVKVEGNYIANINGYAFSVGQLQNTTYVRNNYVYKAGMTQVYNNIGGKVEISGNIFDSVATTYGQYALAVHATVLSDDYPCSWRTDADSVLIFENTFKNVGYAILLRARERLNGAVKNMAPLGSEVYDNVFIPASRNNCTFVAMQFSNGSYSPKIYDNYTDGLNPKNICRILDSDVGSEFDFGNYWLNEAMTDSSELLAVKAINGTVSGQVGITFTGAKIKSAPDCTISAAMPYAPNEVTLSLEVVDGASYKFYSDEKCTNPLPNNTLTVSTGPNSAYAKVSYGEYAIVYTVNLTKKVAYSDYLDPSEFVVNKSFAQYATGQTVYVEVRGEWRRAVIGHSAFSELSLAILNAQKGDVINLMPGRYSGSMTFNKGVTIKGPKAGINPNNMTDFSRSAERSNLNEEAVFDTAMVLAPGINGICFDGVTFTGNAMFTFSKSFVTDGITFTNMLFTGATGQYALLYRARDDNGRNTTANAVLSHNRFEKGATSYLMVFSNISNGLFDSNVFYNCDKPIYFGGIDGSSSEELTFKDNVFYGFTNNIRIGEGTSATAKVSTSVKFDGNRFINCTHTTLVALNCLRTACTFTAVNNRLEGSTKGNFQVNPFAGQTGQSIVMHENFFGSSVSKALTHKLESPANASHNYFANGPANSFSGAAQYSPYYIDAAMTTLTGDYQVAKVNAPANAVLDTKNKTISYTSPTEVQSVTFNLSVSTGATYALYADEMCTIPLANGVVTLTGQKTTAYVKVTAADGVSNAIYTINITQPKSSKTELLGLDIQGSSWRNMGVNKFSSVLPRTYVKGPIIPIISNGATVSVYNSTDVEMKTPVNYSDDLSIPVGKTSYIIKVTSESGMFSTVYNLDIERSANNACDLSAVNGGLQDAVIDGNTVTVTYGYETEKVIPELVVSDNASIAFYADINGTTPKTDENVLKVGENKVYAKVTAEDGVSAKMYTIVMVRMEEIIERNILVGSFPTYATTQEQKDADTTLVGFKYIGGLRIYLMPDNYIDSIEDALIVSEGATYDVFADYNFTTDRPIGTAISTSAEKKTIKLEEGENVFYVRVNGKNNTKTIYELVIQNGVRSTEAEIIDISGFTLTRNGNEITAIADNDVNQIDFILSTNATAKVYSDRKKTMEVPTSMTTYTVTDTQEVYSDCHLVNSSAQAYLEYYVDVTSQSGVTKSYVITLTKGGRKAVFEDAVDHWAENYVSEAYAMGITNGSLNSNGSLSFNPNNNATRQEVAIFICNLMGIDASGYAKSALPYKDAKSIASWAKNAVRAVTAMGIFTGDGTNFNPKANISRQEFMVVIVRACALDTSKATASHIASFKDKNKIASWAKIYVQTAVAYGLVNGDTSGKINPNASITRAEIAKIMVCCKDYAR